jgi:hypothetical protein
MPIGTDTMTIGFQIKKRLLRQRRLVGLRITTRKRCWQLEADPACGLMGFVLVAFAAGGFSFLGVTLFVEPLNFVAELSLVVWPKTPNPIISP